MSDPQLDIKGEFDNAIGELEDLVNQHLTGFIQRAAVAALEAVKHLVEAHVSVTSAQVSQPGPSA